MELLSTSKGFKKWTSRSKKVLNLSKTSQAPTVTQHRTLSYVSAFADTRGTVNVAQADNLLEKSVVRPEARISEGENGKGPSA